MYAHARMHDARACVHRSGCIAIDSQLADLGTHRIDLRSFGPHKISKSQVGSQIGALISESVSQPLSCLCLRTHLGILRAT